MYLQERDVMLGFATAQVHPTDAIAPHKLRNGHKNGAQTTESQPTYLPNKIYPP